eukprot:365239-Chlamydomonas_euryale.AAC.1
MKGKHKHKWDFLREVLTERIVYDDMVHRAWFTDDSMTQVWASAVGVNPGSGVQGLGEGLPAPTR